MSKTQVKKVETQVAIIHLVPSGSFCSQECRRLLLMCREISRTLKPPFLPFSLVCLVFRRQHLPPAPASDGCLPVRARTSTFFPPRLSSSLFNHRSHIDPPPPVVSPATPCSGRTLLIRIYGSHRCVTLQRSRTPCRKSEREGESERGEGEDVSTGVTAVR